MTDEELKRFEERAYGRLDLNSEPTMHWAGVTADRLALLAEVRRLRGVIALGEHRGQHCDWCDAFRKPSAGDKDPHATDCPAFNPDGSVK